MALRQEFYPSPFGILLVKSLKTWKVICVGEKPGKRFEKVIESRGIFMQILRRVPVLDVS